ncbi:MAG: branched-chain amino acid aminotransferase [Planctomycetota bacterium]|nr:branched-chain amino acid aminotransferase [Planctomycetota bacterium]
MAEKGKPGFGADFTPHMALQHYQDGAWGPLEIVPFAPFSLSPSTVVFHYGQEIFEGFKAYRQPDGSVCLFRPEQNLKRLNNSAERLCMPKVDIDATLQAIDKLIATDRATIPDRPNTLYLRPCMFGTDTVIKVNPSGTYIFSVMICVVGDYFGGADPRGVRLRTETEYTRAAPGGTGFAKCGGNYAASLAAQGRAAKDGFDQVVWLDAKTHEYVEEMGGMNIMFVIGETLVTPALGSGTILPGVTRDSLLTLAKSQGRKVEERDVSCSELREAFRKGMLKETFACGTAAVVTPIREIVHKGELLYQNSGEKPGPVTTGLRQQLMDLQFGLAPDPFGWRRKVPL